MKVKYLTWLYEKTGKHEEVIENEVTIKTVNDLLDYLQNKDDNYYNLFKNRHVIYAAVNNDMIPHDQSLNSYDEVVLFSAMVGG